MTRLDDLRALREGLLARLVTCESDQNYAVLARTLTDVLVQIDSLDPPAEVDRGTPADEFTRRLKERRLADAKTLDSTTTG